MYSTPTEVQKAFCNQFNEPEWIARKYAQYCKATGKTHFHFWPQAGPTAPSTRCKLAFLSELLGTPAEREKGETFKDLTQRLEDQASDKGYTWKDYYV